jgi:hypothetical protein
MYVYFRHKGWWFSNILKGIQVKTVGVGGRRIVGGTIVITAVTLRCVLPVLRGKGSIVISEDNQQNMS